MRFVRQILFCLLSALLFFISWPPNSFPIFIFIAFVPILWFVFNFNTGKYEDKIPYEPYQRNRPIYECRCRSGFFFNKTNEFNQHIKTSTHLHFIQNYENYYKEVDDALNIIKELRIENDKLRRKKAKIKNKNKILKKKIENKK